MGKYKVMYLVESSSSQSAPQTVPPPRILQEQMEANCLDLFFHSLLHIQISLSSSAKLAPKRGHCFVEDLFFLPFSFLPHLSESRVYYRVLHFVFFKRKFCKDFTITCPIKTHLRVSLVAQWQRNLPVNAGDMGLIPGPGRSHMLWSD